MFQNLTAYVDIVDRLKDNIAFYEYYYIIEGDRPDQVSMQLYGTTNAYWTFFIFNNKPSNKLNASFLNSDKGSF